MCVCVCVCLYVCGFVQDVCMCMYVHVCVCYNVMPSSGDSSVVSCCFIYNHQRESAGLIL